MRKASDLTTLEWIGVTTLGLLWAVPGYFIGQRVVDWVDMRAEAWAAWAQAILSAAAIVASALISRWTLVRQAAANQLLVEREHQLGVQLRAGPLYVRGKVIVRAMREEIEWQDFLPPSAHSRISWSTGLIKKEVAALQELPVAELPAVIVEAFDGLQSATDGFLGELKGLVEGEAGCGVANLKRRADRAELHVQSIERHAL